MASAPDLDKHVFGTICSRMQERDIRIPTLAAARVTWFLPQLQDSAIWHRILEQPLITPPEQLRRILNLRDVPVSWSQRPTGFISFYVRTFNFKPYELLKVIDKISTNGYENCQILHTWTELLHSIDPTALLHVRYVGKTSYSPWHRF